MILEIYKSNFNFNENKFLIGDVKELHKIKYSEKYTRFQT